MVWMQNVTRDASQFMDYTTGKVFILKGGETKLLPDWFSDKYQGLLKFIKQDNEVITVKSDDIFEVVTKNEIAVKDIIADVKNGKEGLEEQLAKTPSEEPKITKRYTMSAFNKLASMHPMTVNKLIKKGKLIQSKDENGFYMTEEELQKALKMERKING